MKDRVTLTMDRQLLKQIDSSIDGRTVKNRSHAIELLVRRAMEGDVPTHGVILGGSSEEQIGLVLKQKRGKPVIAHNLRLLLDAGINNIIIVTSDSEKIKSALDDEDTGDADITYLSEPNPLGTAGALRLAAPYLTGAFVITNGDEYKEVALKEMYQFHREHAGWCTIALTTTPEPEYYGVALLNGNRIVTFIEKPDRERSPSNLISAGFYIMEPEVLNIVPEGYGRIEVDIFPKLAREDQLYGYPFSGAYEDEDS